MATAFTFNTLQFANRLKKAGIPTEHAEAAVEALSEVFETNTDSLATKADVVTLEERVNSEFKRVNSEIELLRKDMNAMEERINSKFVITEQRITSTLTRNMLIMISAVGTTLAILQHLHWL